MQFFSCRSKNLGIFIINLTPFQDIDVCIESEEDFADQLKEYHGYCDSLRHICKKQELLLLQLQQCEDALESRKLERENFSQGKTGLFGWFALFISLCSLKL